MKLSRRAFSTHIEKKYVYQTYDIIAQHFNHTRFAVWPKVRQFIHQLSQPSLVYDIGCGNGKYLNNQNHYILGTDSSVKLLACALAKYQKAQLMASDILRLPIRPSSCDAFICIAVLHHLSTVEHRLKALKQLSRILKPKGKGLIYVWCFQQHIKNAQPLPADLRGSNYAQGQDILVRWHLQQKYANQIKENSQFDYQPSKHSVVVKRFYHLFKKDELEQLIGKVASLKIKDSYFDKQNWCCIVQRQ